MHSFGGGGDGGLQIIVIFLAVALVIGIFAYNSCGTDKLADCYNDDGEEIRLMSPGDYKDKWCIQEYDGEDGWVNVQCYKAEEAATKACQSGSYYDD